MARVSSDTPSTLDRRMWRLLKARCHPDQGGSHELFVWIDALWESLCGRNGSRETAPPPPPEDDGRAEFFSSYRTSHAQLLWMVKTGYAALYYEEKLATKKQIAYIAHLAEMSKSDRFAFYEACEDFGLTKPAASWLIEELNDG